MMLAAVHLKRQELLSAHCDTSWLAKQYTGTCLQKASEGGVPRSSRSSCSSAGAAAAHVGLFSQIKSQIADPPRQTRLTNTTVRLQVKLPLLFGCLQRKAP